jgi:hypothetical protein
MVEGLRLLTWTRLSAQVDWRALPSPLRAQFSDTFSGIRSAQDALRACYRLAPGA